MAFNAHWTLEDLASEKGTEIETLIRKFATDFRASVEEAPIYRLRVTDNGNQFTLRSISGAAIKPSSVAGLYTIFTRKGVVYFGEATNLLRRQLYDPDNTAASNKTFSNQGRAIIKFLAYKGWAGLLGLEDLYMQIYAETMPLAEDDAETLESRYLVSRYSKSLEGLGALMVGSLFPNILQALERATATEESGS